MKRCGFVISTYTGPAGFSPTASGSAYTEFAENEKGALKKGKLTDLTVLTIRGFLSSQSLQRTSESVPFRYKSEKSAGSINLPQCF
jgi:hypothetical protein